jgi:adenosylhomocysteine nucleosidase
MMLGIVVSLPWELRSLTRQTIPFGALRALTDNTLVALSGMGAVRAYAGAELLVDHGATELMSWGCAAALDPRLNAGSLILPEHIIAASGEIHRVCSEWHQRLYQILAHKFTVHTGPLAETDAIVQTSASKSELERRTRAVAVDMESGAHARVAEKHRLPFITIRAIVDTASTNLPKTLGKALDPDGGISAWKLLTSAFFLPSDGIKIVRLGFQFNSARKTLKKSRNLVLRPLLP